jgi:hypothetical protein
MFPYIHVMYSDHIYLLYYSVLSPLLFYSSAKVLKIVISKKKGTWFLLLFVYSKSLIGLIYA